MSPAQIEALQAVARAAEAAPHGSKAAVYQEAAARMGLSLATLHRKLKEVSMPIKTRQRRSDAGKTSMSRDDALLLSAYLQESQRANGKRLASIESALDVLRANNPTFASRVDDSSGEVMPLSVSAVSRALTHYRLHPDQLALPTPKVQLASEHPNHVWQIDPSLCVVYYLAKKSGLQVMEEKEFYKNKPGNVERIEKERVWRYVITDHASGWIYVHYVPGAETGKNLAEAFIAATQKREAEDPVHGLPRMVMVDPGSANTGAVFRNLCNALDIQLMVNQPGQPWAKGQVEKANDIVERDFEHRLAFMQNPPTCIDELNPCAWRWMRWYNSTKVHSRHGHTRFAAWMRITAEQLRIAPPANVMRELCYTAEQTRKVTPLFTISHGGNTYSVNDIPGVEVGEQLRITRNPWRDDTSIQVLREVEGKTFIHVLEPQKLNEFGFADTAAKFGQEYKAQPDSQVDKNRKAVERLAMDASTDTEAQAKRKSKATPLGGIIDPMKNVDNTTLPQYLNKRGNVADINSPVLELPNLTPVALAKKIAAQIGTEWKGAEHFAWLKQRYPEGAPESEIPAIIQQLRSAFASPLRVIK